MLAESQPDFGRPEEWEVGAMNDNVLYHSLSESGSNLTDLRQIEIPSSRHSSTLLAHCMSGQG